MDELVQGGRRMTVKEVAGVLGVSEDTVLNSIKSLETQPEEIRFEKMQGTHGGKPYYALSEAQVTAVKMNLRKNLQAAAMPKTDLEKELIIQQALVYQQEKIKTLTDRLAIAEPKAEALDGISAGEGDITVKELAAILALPNVSEKALIRRLHEDGCLTKEGIPDRRLIDRGILYVKFTGTSGKPRLMITPKGLAHFSMKYAAGRCKADSADALKPCTGYRIGKKYGGAWLRGLDDGKRNRKLSYSQDQNEAPAVCRACIKIIENTVHGFYPRNYVFLKSPESRHVSQVYP